jgi:hypothetical protein
VAEISSSAAINSNFANLVERGSSNFKGAAGPVKVAEGSVKDQLITPNNEGALSSSSASYRSKR